MGRRVRGPASGWTGGREPATGWAGTAVQGRWEGELVPAVCEGEPVQGRAVRCMGRWRTGPVEDWPVLSHSNGPVAE